MRDAFGLGGTVKYRTVYFAVARIEDFIVPCNANGAASGSKFDVGISPGEIDAVRVPRSYTAMNA